MKMPVEMSQEEIREQSDARIKGYEKDDRDRQKRNKRVQPILDYVRAQLLAHRLAGAEMASDDDGGKILKAIRDADVAARQPDAFEDFVDALSEEGRVLELQRRVSLLREATVPGWKNAQIVVLPREDDLKSDEDRQKARASLPSSLVEVFEAYRVRWARSYDSEDFLEEMDGAFSCIECAFSDGSEWHAVSDNMVSAWLRWFLMGNAVNPYKETKWERSGFVNGARCPVCGSRWIFINEALCHDFTGTYMHCEDCGECNFSHQGHDDSEMFFLHNVGIGAGALGVDAKSDGVDLFAALKDVMMTIIREEDGWWSGMCSADEIAEASADRDAAIDSCCHLLDDDSEPIFTDTDVAAAISSLVVEGKIEDKNVEQGWRLMVL